MDGVALRALLTQRYGLPTAAIDENMQKLVTLRGSFKPPRALAAPPERPPERAKKRKQLGSRLPATPQHPLRQAFSKAWWVWGGRLGARARWWKRTARWPRGEGWRWRGCSGATAPKA